MDIETDVQVKPRYIHSQQLQALGIPGLSDLEAVERTPARLPWFARRGDARLTEAKGKLIVTNLWGNNSGMNY